MHVAAFSEVPVSMIDPNADVASFVTERPSRSRVFESFDIDYCCADLHLHVHKENNLLLPAAEARERQLAHA